MLESLIQNLSVRIRASVLLSICKESHHVFLSNDRAEAWGILLGRNVCSFRVINSIRKLRFGKDYYHNNIWNYDEYNLKGLPRIVEYERKKNAEFVGTYHSHPYGRFNINQQTDLDTSLSQSDAMTFQRLGLNPNAVISYVNFRGKK